MIALLMFLVSILVALLFCIQAWRLCFHISDHVFGWVSRLFMTDIIDRTVAECMPAEHPEGDAPSDEKTQDREKTAALFRKVIEQFIKNLFVSSKS